jgi:hypothetical protein
MERGRKTLELHIVLEACNGKYISTRYNTKQNIYWVVMLEGVL